MANASLHNFRNSWRIKFLGGSLIVLLVCEILLILDVVSESLYFDFDIYSEYHGIIEASAVFFLGLTLIVLGADFWRLIIENRQFRSLLGIASGEFLFILGGKFTDWKLSVSEREVALLLIKGLSIQEIADIRETKTGTIKSQCSAIYRKAEVKGRNELVAYFVEDLLSGESLSDIMNALPPQVEGANS
ncbi:MAG: helix-turn-helix transcriptional regulator [Rhodospirillaceae bacterium]|jgi:DNA-binding CsgD family transcriptional regulator|nr:helix-turn-helix transcriptional regulator [Rhodospirillaceae bacterium]MBT5245395.1 helix-turn-helix transcriptional regulator [Rhodospirillaceae bacterium]MBT5562551.1 helix-turn-helix transcriptional regulator [Rhodospirillaceae bacterium]MBT6242876.1 helix-turn-helix transcriptional regulator [Rhodospirillaceae bacterium]